MNSGLLVIGILFIIVIVILFYIMMLELKKKSEALQSVQESLDEIMTGKKPDNDKTKPVPDTKIENVQESLSRPGQGNMPSDAGPESIIWDVEHIQSKFLPEENGIYHKIDIIPDTAWSDMKDVLKKLTKLPIELTELLAVLNSPDSSSASVSKICDSSVGITAMVLKMVNSAYYCLGRHISDIKEAVTFLGFDEIRQAVLTMSLFSGSNVSGANFKISKLFKHSVATANITPWLIKRTGLKIHTPSTGSGAMLHGIGKLFLNRWRRGRFDNAISIASESNISLMEAELETLGITHALAGELIAIRMHLPPALTYIIKASNLPELDSSLPEPAIIYISSQIAKYYFGLDNGEDLVKEINPEIRTVLGLKEKMISQLIDKDFADYADDFMSELNPVIRI